MPRFYFDVREGEDFTSDDKGMEFPNLRAAEHEAVVAAAEIARDRLPKGHARNIAVEVYDKHRQRLTTVTVRMEIDRVDLSSEPSST
jgi:hypothetical protein